MIIDHCALCLDFTTRVCIIKSVSGGPIGNDYLTIENKSKLKNAGCVTDFWIYESMRARSCRRTNITELSTFRPFKYTYHGGFKWIW